MICETVFGAKVVGAPTNPTPEARVTRRGLGTATASVVIGHDPNGRIWGCDAASNLSR